MTIMSIKFACYIFIVIMSTVLYRYPVKARKLIWLDCYSFSSDVFEMLHTISA